MSFLVKELIWLGSTLDDLKLFPEEVQDEVGYALHCVLKWERLTNQQNFLGDMAPVSMK